jgi:broad specificity phosphatase PhoE
MRASRDLGALLLCALAWAWPAPGAAAETALWQALRSGGLVLMLRHAETDPGIGDPPDFRLGDCATQRNLSAAGRAQSQRLGQRLKQQGVKVDAVYSSRWCRCLDTARLAFGRVQALPALDSFFSEPQRAQAQTAELRRQLAGFKGPGNLVLVTHQVNITALTGIHPAMGETVVLQRAGDGALEVIGRLPPP